MSTETQQANTAPPPPPPAGFWKPRHAVIGIGIVVLLVLMVRACGEDEPAQQADRQEDKPRQSVVVQIPPSQVQAAPGAVQPGTMPPGMPVQQPAYGYAPQVPAQTQAVPVAPPASNNPWAVNTPSSQYGQYRTQQWGQSQPRQPQYVQPSGQPQYRPLEPPAPAAPTVQAPPVQQVPVPVYRPMAPYDRLSGSSFGTPRYPYYGGAGYPGYHAPGVYGGAPGGAYAPAWPYAAPGMGWPGYW